MHNPELAPQLNHTGRFGRLVAAGAVLASSVFMGGNVYADDDEATPISPEGKVCAQAVGEPGDFAVLNLTPVQSDGAGYGAVRASDAPSNNTLGAESVSNVNFNVGTVDPNVAFSKIGPDGKFCFDNSAHSTIHLVADQMGTIDGDVFTPASATGAKRLIDTRVGKVVGGTPVNSVAPGAAVCAQAVGEPGDFAVLNLTPVQSDGAGYGAVRASDAPSNNTLGAESVSNVNFNVGTVDPNVAFSKIGPDGKFCFDNSAHSTIHLVADQMGTIDGDVFTPASATGAKRLVDTRRGFVFGGDVDNPGGGNSGIGGIPIESSGGGLPSYTELRMNCVPVDADAGFFIRNISFYTPDYSGSGGNMQWVQVAYADNTETYGPYEASQIELGGQNYSWKTVTDAFEDADGIRGRVGTPVADTVTASAYTMGGLFVAESVDISNFPLCSSFGNIYTFYKERWKGGVLLEQSAVHS